MRQRVTLIVCVLIVPMPVPAQTPQELTARLKDGDARSRRQAAEALGRRKVADAMPALAALLRDADANVREAAAVALTRIGPPAVPALAKALAAPAEDERLAALAALDGIGPPAKAALAELTAALKDKSPAVRIRAATVLMDVGPEAKPALPALFEAARDRGRAPTRSFGVAATVSSAAIGAALRVDPDCGPRLAELVLPDLLTAIRGSDAEAARQAFFILSRLGPHARAAVPTLRDKLNAGTGGDDSFLIGALLTIGGDDAVAVVAGLLANAKVPVERRVRVIESFSFPRAVTPPVYVALLAPLLKSPEPRVKAAAVGALANYGPAAKPTIPTLIELLADEELNKGTRLSSSLEFRTVARALATIGPDAVRPLAELVKDDATRSDVRFRAARALALMKGKAKDALPELHAASRLRSPFAAQEAACAYVLAGGDDVAGSVRRLRAGLASDDVFIAASAAHALQRLGRRAQDAAPDLVPLLEHTDDLVRIAAAHAICSIGTTDASVVKPLAKLLKSESPYERHEVCGALADLGAGAREAMPAIIPLLKAPDRDSILDPPLSLLQAMGPAAEPAVPALVERLEKAAEQDSWRVLYTLQQIGPGASAAVPALVARLEKPQSRDNVARALAMIGPKAKAAVPALRKLLDDDDERTQVWANAALATITGDARPHVLRLIELADVPPGRLWSRSPNRWDAIKALTLLGPAARPARDLFLAAVREKAGFGADRAAVARALGFLADDSELVVPKLAELLDFNAELLTDGRVDLFADAQRRSVVVAAADALSRFGPKAKSAVPRLRRLLTDDDEAIAAAAKAALKRIEDK